MSFRISMLQELNIVLEHALCRTLKTARALSKGSSSPLRSRRSRRTRHAGIAVAGEWPPSPGGHHPSIVAEKLMNPLVDLSALPATARITSVQVMPDAVLLKASSSLIADRSTTAF